MRYASADEGHSLIWHMLPSQLTPSTCGIVVQSRPPSGERTPSIPSPTATHPPHCSRLVDVSTHSDPARKPTTYVGHGLWSRAHDLGKTWRFVGTPEGEGTDAVVAARKMCVGERRENMHGERKGYTHDKRQWWCLASRWMLHRRDPCIAMHQWSQGMSNPATSSPAQDTGSIGLNPAEKRTSRRSTGSRKLLHKRY
jgi:hypothetical protein